MNTLSNKYTADFETTTDINDCRVWAWGISSIEDPSYFIYGNDIYEFFKWCSHQRKNPILYFHNLKFDGEYIFYWLLTNDFEYIKDKSEARNRTFTCVISDMGMFYSIEIYFKVGSHRFNKVTIYDSLKILNFSVKEIAKSFDLEVQKGEIDYTAYRKEGHILTDEEVSYLKNDVVIMAQALKIMFTEGLDKMTIGSSALKMYKEMNNHFKYQFPILPYEIDKDIRSSYKGGFTYLNPKYKEKLVNEGGYIYDVNSLYPSVMYNEYLPYDDPIYFEGQYKNDEEYPLYVQRITCSFKIKENKIPSIQIKSNQYFAQNEYLESSDDRVVSLTLTSVDLELFFNQYNVEDLEYISGWKFRQVKGVFCDYIDKYTKLKIESKKNGNKALYLIAKLCLNSLYGKFGLNPLQGSKYPYLAEDGHVAYAFNEVETRDSVYVPMATFITSYARKKTILTSQAIRDYSLEKYNEDYYIYSDTDSIHTKMLPPEELKDIFEIDKYKLGAWDCEGHIIKGKYIRQKCYMETVEDGGKIETKITIAGLPKKMGYLVNFDNFKVGMSIKADPKEKEQKLAYKHVKGGVVLVPVDFSIKE